jgi:hypothetical protein
VLRVRTFLLDANSVPRPYPAARFQRLWDGDPREHVVGHAGAFAQFADVFVEVTSDGRPVRVLRIDTLRIRLDSTGRLDQRQKEQLLSLAVRSLRLSSPWPRGAVVAADHRFAQRAMRAFRWLPTAAQRATMERLVLTQRQRR